MFTFLLGEFDWKVLFYSRLIPSEFWSRKVVTWVVFSTTPLVIILRSWNVILSSSIYITLKKSYVLVWILWIFQMIILLQVPPLTRQVIIVLTQLEGSGGFSIAHRLTHRLANSQGLYDWGSPGSSHSPELDYQTSGLHAPRLF